MIRTRDFILFLAAVAFLVLAIGFEVIQTIFVSPFDVDREVPEFSGGEGSSPEAEVIVAADTRSERIAKLKEIIGSVTTPVTSEMIEEIVVTETATTSVVESDGPLLCSTYLMYSGTWSPNGITITEREGVRIFHESAIGTSTDGIGVIRIILPMREFPSPTPVCLPSDVVGIALDGSLIRNNEQATYGVFGEATVVGYALDGFPIHGASTVSTDSCGGTITPSGYRYYLSSERDSVLGCLAAPAVPL